MDGDCEVPALPNAAGAHAPAEGIMTNPLCTAFQCKAAIIIGEQCISIAGERFIVTGSSGGIGAAIAAAYVQEGAHVVGRDRRIATEHDASDMTFIPCAVSSKTDVFDAVGRAVDLLGGLDEIGRASGRERVCPYV